MYSYRLRKEMGIFDMKTKIIAIALVLFMILPSFLIPINAVPNSTKSLFSVHTDEKTLRSVTDIMEDDFNSPETDWEALGGAVQTISEINCAPYAAYEGERSLLVTSDAESNGYLAVTKTVTELTSLRKTPIITLTVFVPKELEGSILTLALKTDKGDVKSSLSVECGSWQTLFFDLSSEKGNAVYDITVSVSNSNTKSITFLLDCIGGCRSREAVFKAKYLSGEYTASGGDLSTENGLSLSFTSGEKYIEAMPEAPSFEEGQGIRIALINSSTCTSVTAVITSPDYTETRTTYKITSGSVSFTIPIPNELVSSFKIIFDGDPIGQVDLLSVSKVQCYSLRKTVGEISEVRVGRDKKSISVKGSVSEKEFELLKGAKLRLYELRLDQDVSDVTPSVSPISEIDFSSESFEFSVPIDDNQDRIFKKYAVAAVGLEGLIPIGSAKAVNNPNVFADDKVALPESIKGSSCLKDNYFLDGIAQTTFDIFADELISVSSGGISYTDGGRKYTFSSEYTEKLDAVMKKYAVDGISVRFILRLRSQSEDLSLSNIHHPKNNGGEYSAFNTTSSNAINTLRAITSFLISRYSSGEVSDNLFGIILGSDVNDSFESYNMGNTSLSELTLAYSAAFITVFNTARMKYSNFEVSVPINNSWYSADTASVTGSFEASSFLESFTLCISASSDIEWSLSCDVTPYNNSYSFEETSVDKTCFAKTVTAANLEVPVSFMRCPSRLYNGMVRKIILVGMMAKEAEDEISSVKLSSEFVYTYLRALSMEEIHAYIPSHTAGNENVIRYIDTQLINEKTAFASEFIGSDRLEKLIQNAVGNTSRYDLTSQSSKEYPSSIKGKVKLFSFSKDTDGFIPHANCAVAEGGISYGEAKGLMRFRLTEADPGSYRGVTANLDKMINLSNAPYLTFTIRTAVLPEGVNELEIAVVIGSGRNTFVSTSKIYANSDNTVICDLSAFPYASACDKISIYVRDTYGTGIGEPTLLMSSVYAMSDSLSGTALKNAVYGKGSKIKVSLNTVIAVMSCGIAAIAAFVLRVIYGLKKSKSQENK